MATQRAQIIRSELESYFHQDETYKVDKFIGSGNHAATYRIARTVTVMDKKEYFVIKRAFEGEDHEAQLHQERKVLFNLRSNQHIVNVLDLPNVPNMRDNENEEGEEDKSKAPTKSKTGRQKKGGTKKRNGKRRKRTHVTAWGSPSRITKHGTGGVRLTSESDDDDDGGDESSSGSDPDDDDHGGLWKHVLCLEWLDNGTLRSFIIKAKRRSQHLPNRLMWRFLYCLLQAVAGLAWPITPNAQGTPEPETPRSKSSPLKRKRDPIQLSHNDLHDGNIMLGLEIPNEHPEHDITPILKWIDFGLAGEFVGGNGSDPLYGINGNLYDAGRIMCGIIQRQTWEGQRLEHATKFKDLEDNIIETDATLWPTSAGGPDPIPNTIDKDLRKVVSCMMATQKEDRPEIYDFMAEVRDMIKGRDATYYKGRVEEEDDNIRKLWLELVAEAEFVAQVAPIILSD